MQGEFMKYIVYIYIGKNETVYQRRETSEEERAKKAAGNSENNRFSGNRCVRFGQALRFEKNVIVEIRLRLTRHRRYNERIAYTVHRIRNENTLISGLSNVLERDSRVPVL